MNLKDKETKLWVLISGIWFVTTFIASLSQLGKDYPIFANFWYIAIFLTIGVMLLMLYRGSMHKGKVNMQFYMVSIVWGIVWVVGFILAQYHTVAFKGKMPAFTIFGVHPSFAWIMIFYWILGTGVILLGFYFKSDLWLSQSQWDEFVESVTAPASSAVKTKKAAKKTTAKKKAKAKSKAKKK